MGAYRIKDFVTTATSPANDDYIAIDGSTNGTRKILADSFAPASDIVTYSISISSNVITLTGSDSSTSTVTLPVYSGGVS